MSVIFRILGIAIMGALVAASVLGMLDPGASGPAPATPRSVPSQGFSPLPPINAQARSALLDRSPFVQGRSAFDRQTALAPPPIPMDVRLTGVSKFGKEYRASLSVDGKSQTVKTGDRTPLGVVTSIEASAVVIEGATTQRIEMFKP